MMVQQYHDSHTSDKEILLAIQKAVASSPELRSKKALIENFISGINEVEDVLSEWTAFVAEEKERELVHIINYENLNEKATRAFIANAFIDGFIKTNGTDIDKILPPMSRFGSSDREEKKQRVIAQLSEFFDRFYGLGE